VLIANYNNEYYIKDCINSLINQTYKNIEIIFHDDCSNDNSLEIEKIKKDEKKRLIISKNNFKLGKIYHHKPRAINILKDL